MFHPDSYGYRPRRSAIDAVGQARQRCWRFDWVVDIDIKGFFDSIDHELMYGRCASTRLPLGAALHRTLAESAGADGGRQSCAARRGGRRKEG